MCNTLGFIKSVSLIKLFPGDRTRTWQVAGFVPSSATKLSYHPPPLANFLFCSTSLFFLFSTLKAFSSSSSQLSFLQYISVVSPQLQSFPVILLLWPTFFSAWHICVSFSFVPSLATKFTHDLHKKNGFFYSKVKIFKLTYMFAKISQIHYSDF